MYKNRISRPTPNSHPQFYIRRSEIAFDERVAFVDHVCATLIESRFGPGYVFETSPVVINWRDRPDHKPALFSDLLDEVPNGLLPCYSLSPLGRAGYQVVEAAYRRAKQMGLLDAASHGGSLTSGCSSNLGRGSP